MSRAIDRITLNGYKSIASLEQFEFDSIYPWFLSLNGHLNLRAEQLADESN